MGTLLVIITLVLLLMVSSVVPWAARKVVLQSSVISDVRLGSAIKGKMKWVIVTWAGTVVLGTIMFLGDTFRYSLDIILRDLLAGRL
jgi:hypothetical protein